MSGWVGPSGASGTDNNSVKSAVVGTTGQTVSLSSVTAGQLVVLFSRYVIGTSQTPTFSDTSGNVTSWATPVVFFDNHSATNPSPANYSVTWGIATSTGSCNPKVTWNSSTSATMDLYAGVFTTPGGTISQDGSTVTGDSNTSGNVATVVLPAGGGSGSNDLVLNTGAFGAAFSTMNSPWALMGPVQSNINGWVANAAGNSTPNVTQSSSSAWFSMVVALQAAGAAIVSPVQMFGPSYAATRAASI